MLHQCLLPQVSCKPAVWRWTWRSCNALFHQGYPATLPPCMHGCRTHSACAHSAVRAGKRNDTEEPGQLHHALKYGAPSAENLRFFRNFVVSYDARLRNPRWVVEHISRDSTRGEANRCLFFPACASLHGCLCHPP